MKKDDFAEKNDAATGLAVPATVKLKYGKSPSEHASEGISDLTAVQNHIAASSSIEDVPAEVRAALTGYDDLLTDERILGVMESCQAMTLDKIILTLWHRFKHTQPRNEILTRLRALIKREEVERMHNARSVYRRLPKVAAGLGPHPAD